MENTLFEPYAETNGFRGIFEFIDMCNEAGLEPVVTTTAVCDECTAEAMADLVDYCHDVNGTTAYGKQRIADGHPDKFDVRFFELGKPVTVQYYNADVTMTLEQKNAMPPIDTVQQRG
jgi:alpha-L-arabinofuranosidase